MTEKVSGFDWDSGNWPKCGKHGVSREEIEEIFHSNPRLMNDPFPDEKRIRAIGITSTGRYLFVVFIFRMKDNRNLIRPISARYMHKKEIDCYETYRT